MTQTYKILILDIDGTTVASGKDSLPSQRVIATIHEAKKKLHVAVATGRPLVFALPVLTALGLDGLSVFNGGAEVINVSTQQILHQQQIPIESVRELVTLMLPFGFKIYPDSEQYNSVITTSKQVSHPLSKLFVEGVDPLTATHMIEVLSAVEGVSAQPTTSWQSESVVDVHVTHEHATKRYGVEKLLQLLKLDTAEAIAIGDGYNDLPMMEAAGFKVAMGNAPYEIQAVADYVAPSLADDGVAETIERYILA